MQLQATSILSRSPVILWSSFLLPRIRNYWRYKKNFGCELKQCLRPSLKLITGFLVRHIFLIFSICANQTLGD